MIVNNCRSYRLLRGIYGWNMENLKAAVGLHFNHYKFVRIHSSLRVTPAMAARVTEHLWSISDLLEWGN
jgi:hypothetical protein